MASGKKRRKRILDSLTSKYRLVIMNDDTFEEQASFRLSRINLYVLVSIVFLIMISITIGGIVFTPLKEYIPGYSDIYLRRDITLLKLRADSVEKIIDNREIYLENLRRVVEGRADTANIEETEPSTVSGNLNWDKLVPADSILRADVENEENFILDFNRSAEQRGISGFSFFTPLKGFITEAYSKKDKHFGVDVVGQENATIQAVLEGTVIMSAWTLETGFVIGIQHDNELVSFYKHNSVIFKKVGTFVEAGDAIAIIGSSGELTTGPHLHFELWHQGMPLDPEEYIVFN